MRLPRSWPLALAVLAAAAPPDLAPFPTLACYKRASERLGLTNVQSEQLCVGATSTAPTRCYDAATHTVGLTDLDAVRLCQLATSTEPARCVAHLERTTGYDQATIVSYCTAATYALAPPPEPGAASCLVAAKQTLLADVDSLRLCQGSRTPEPVACYRWGKDHTLLPDADLVTLCAPMVPYALPYGVAVPGVYP